MLSFLCRILLCAEYFFSVRILRNDKSSLYPQKCFHQVTRMLLTLMRIVLCIRIMFKHVKLQFIWYIKVKCGFCGNKNDNHDDNANSKSRINEKLNDINGKSGASYFFFFFLLLCDII